MLLDHMIPKVVVGHVVGHMPLSYAASYTMCKPEFSTKKKLRKILMKS